MTFEWSYDGGATTVGDGTAVLAVGGPDILSVGAEVTVGAADPAGTYTGTFPVTVDYQ
jgi:spore coat protein U-like protein